MACQNTTQQDAEIEQLLDLGIYRTYTDGTGVEHNLGMVQQRLREKQQLDPARALCQTTRPSVMNARTPFRGF